MPQFKKAQKEQRAIEPQMKSNIIKAALQRSINHFLQLRKSANPKSKDYRDYGRMASVYITVKNSI